MVAARTVSLPMVLPSLTAGAVLAWARSMGEFGATVTFAGNLPGRTQTLPLATFLAMETDLDQAILLSLLLLAESIVVNQGIKRVVGRPRPQVVEPRPHHVRRPMTSSFPSGHASSAAFAAATFSQRHPRRAPLYYGLAAIVATSRVHVQVHHASDVIAGAAIGTAFARLAARLWPPPPPPGATS